MMRLYDPEHKLRHTSAAMFDIPPPKHPLDALVSVWLSNEKVQVPVTTVRLVPRDRASGSDGPWRWQSGSSDWQSDWQSAGWQSWQSEWQPESQWRQR
jgi:hypothetical protein